MLKAFVCRKAGGPGHSGVEHTCVLALSCESRTVGVKEFEFLKPFFLPLSHMGLQLSSLGSYFIYGDMVA